MKATIVIYFGLKDEDDSGRRRGGEPWLTNQPGSRQAGVTPGKLALIARAGRRARRRALPAIRHRRQRNRRRSAAPGRWRPIAGRATESIAATRAEASRPTCRAAQENRHRSELAIARTRVDRRVRSVCVAGVVPAAAATSTNEAAMAQSAAAGRRRLGPAGRARGRASQERNRIAGPQAAGRRRDHQEEKASTWRSSATRKFTSATRSTDLR